jgi:FAD/FMN-containing dehydrogenase
MRPLSYLRAGSATTLNVVLNAATLGRFVWLEGRVRRSVFLNWARRFRYRPERFVQPEDEQEIADLVASTRRLRVFGSAHSFNDGVVTDGTLVSLDRFSGAIANGGARDHEHRGNDQLAVKGGTRVRDVVKLLRERGLALAALPSHDAQSIAGILSTDVHGTGTDWGFVSDSVVGLTVMDGRGQRHECAPSDDLFKAAIGGVGAVGIITGVVVQALPRFDVQQRVRIDDLAVVERDLDRLLEKHDHLSLYLFPFSAKCQVNTWDRTEDRRSRLGNVREFVSISLDALLASWLGNLLAYAGLLPKLGSRVYIKKRGTDLVLESDAAFNRTIYHLHQELELTVPFEQTFEASRRFIDLYERIYHRRALPYTVIEVRFTPEGHDRTLIGAGRGRRSTWIDLVCTDSEGFEDYYAAAVELAKEIGARPHLGKFCDGFSKADLARLHGESFSRFLTFVEAHDPDGKFANELTGRLLGHSPGRGLDRT